MIESFAVCCICEGRAPTDRGGYPLGWIELEYHINLTVKKGINNLTTTDRGMKCTIAVCSNDCFDKIKIVNHRTKEKN